MYFNNPKLRTTLKECSSLNINSLQIIFYSFYLKALKQLNNLNNYFTSTPMTGGAR